MARGDVLALHGIETVEVCAMTSSLLVQPVSVTSHLSCNTNPNDAAALRSREVVRENGGSQPRIFSWTSPLPTGLLCRQRGWGWNLILPSLASQYDARNAHTTMICRMIPAHQDHEPRSPVLGSGLSRFESELLAQEPRARLTAPQDSTSDRADPSKAFSASCSSAT